MVEHSNEAVSTKRRCELLNIQRSAVYYKPVVVESDYAVVMNEVRSIYVEHPSYGYRRMLVALREKWFLINHKRLQRLLSVAGIKAVYPKRNISMRNSQHKVYPYLLREMPIVRPNQVWAIDITYIKIRGGFVYLVCIIDVFSRRVMGSALSIFLDTKACIEAFNEALKHGTPEIMNSDQGCQFTSDEWTGYVVSLGIKISMDGKGRWADNVYVERLWRTIKYEHVFMHGFDTVDEARVAIKNFIVFYNQRRPHQSLNYHTPSAIFDLGTIPSKQHLFEQFKLRHQARIGEFS